MTVRNLIERVVDRSGMKALSGRIAVVAILSALVFSTSAIAVSAATNVTSRAGVHEGFVRIAFDWPAAQKLPGYSAEIAANQLVESSATFSYKIKALQNELIVRFDEPLQSDFSGVRRGLADYVSAVRLSEDGREVRVTFSGDYKLRHAVYDNVIAVDLLTDPPEDTSDETSVGTSEENSEANAEETAEIAEKTEVAENTANAPALGPQIAPQLQPAAESEQISLTEPLAGAVPPDAVALEPDGAGSETEIVQDLADQSPLAETQLAVAETQLPEAKAQLPAAETVAASLDNQIVASEVKFDEAINVKLPQLADGGAELIVTADAYDSFTRINFQWPMKVVYRVRQQPGLVSITFNRGTQPFFGDLAMNPPAPIKVMTSTVDDDQVTVHVAVSHAIKITHRTDNRTVELDLIPSVDEPETSPVVALDDSKKFGAEYSTADADAEGEATADHLVVAVDDGPNGIRLRFPWKTPVPAAIFRRSGYLWVIFDAHDRADLSAFDAKYESIVAKAEQLPNRYATILRFRIMPGFFPTVQAEGPEWRIILAPQSEPPGLPLEVRREARDEGQGLRILLPVTGSGTRLFVADPEAGDRLLVVPIVTPGRGMVGERNFAQFNLLDTLQGIAVLALVDDIDAKPKRDGVAIENDEGLVLSRANLPESYDTGGAVSKFAGKPRSEIDFDAWSMGGRDSFNHNLHLLLSGLANAPEDKRIGARWNLARFYLAHGFANDASGVLKMISQDDPITEDGPAFALMRAITNVKQARWADAFADLGHRELGDNPHAALWRSLVMAARSDWEATVNEFEKGIDSLTFYPGDEVAAFRLAVARAMLNTGQIRKARQHLAAVDESTVESVGVLATIKVLKGRSLQQQGDMTTALALYDEVIALDHRPSVMEARLWRNLLRLKSGDASVSEVIDDLEKMRFAWRGDDLELQVMHHLGTLNIDEGNYSEGLGAMRRAMTYFPEAKGAKAVNRDMHEIFKTLFLGPQAAEMPVISALALYNDFRELTPLGNEGDEMIRRLSDRLVEVDLLNKAAELLAHQVQYRLAGVARAQVAARLAVIYMLDHKPQKALEVIRKTAIARLPTEYDTKRRYIEVRALLAMKLFEQGLDLLGGNRSAEADKLRAKIHWEAQDWPQAAKLAEKVLDESWKEEEALTPDQRKQVIRMVISMSLNDDVGGLQRIKERYETKMVASDEYEFFDMMTAAGVDRNSLEFRELAGSIAALNTIDAFMDNYKRMAQSGKLSTAMTNGG